MLDVLCLSDCCCDLVFQGLPALPELGAEVYCQGLAIHAGGGANTPMGLARLGCHTGYAASLGTDALGALVLQELQAAGVNTDYMEVGPERKTWVSAVLSTAGERSFASYAGSGRDYGGPWLRQAIRGARHVHTYLHYARQYPAIAALCRELGVTLSMDMGDDPSLHLAEVADVLRQADVITPNHREACQLTGTREPRQALNALACLCPAVVMTMGEQGCLAVMDGCAYRAVPPRVQAVNANGAGDLFNAGLLYARSKGMPAPQQLRLACAAGAAAVSGEGSASQRFTLEQVHALAAQVQVERLA